MLTQWLFWDKMTVSMHHIDPWNDEDLLDLFMDHLEMQYGPIAMSDGRWVRDDSCITSDFLIANINDAVSVDLLQKQCIFASASMWRYPFDLPMSKVESGKRGSCRHLVNYTASAMRSVGIPVC